MAISVLPPQVANQIAAGEVVERPSAVVKELVENAFDAGASKVQVEIEQGGAKLILVRDNGSGICEAELPLALKRHATSKLHTIEDLDYLSSMGFRGEALASVAAVSRLSLTSKTATEALAHVIRVDGIGQIPQIEPAAHPVGTTVEVVDLFFNTPARRRFMRSEKSEFLQIEEIFRRLALSRPDCALSLKNNGRLVYDFRVEAQSDRPNRRMAKIFGGEFAETAVKIEVQADDLCLHGFCAIAESAKPLQYFFVNGRIVKDKVVIRAISDAYEEVLGRKANDSYVCFLTMPQALVDINVHPQKYEVRFQNARYIHDFIAGGFVNALRNATSIFTENFGETQAVPLAHNYCGVTALKYNAQKAAQVGAELTARGQALSSFTSEDVNGAQAKAPFNSCTEGEVKGIHLGSQGGDFEGESQSLPPESSLNYCGGATGSPLNSLAHGANQPNTVKDLSLNQAPRSYASVGGGKESYGSPTKSGPNHASWGKFNPANFSPAEKKASINATSSYYDRIFSRPENQPLEGVFAEATPLARDSAPLDEGSLGSKIANSIFNGSSGDLWADALAHETQVNLEGAQAQDLGNVNLTQNQVSSSRDGFKASSIVASKENENTFAFTSDLNPPLSSENGPTDEEVGGDGLPILEPTVFFAPWFTEPKESLGDNKINFLGVTQKHYALAAHNGQFYLWDLALLAQELVTSYLKQNRSRVLGTSNLMVPVEITSSKDPKAYMGLLRALGFEVELKGLKASSLVIAGVPAVMRCMNVAKVVDDLILGLEPLSGEQEAIDFLGRVLCALKMPLYFTAEMAARLLRQVPLTYDYLTAPAVKELKFDRLVKELFGE